MHVDLFSGIGGFAYGLRDYVETVLFCECEPAAQRVLAHHWPGVPIFDDVRTLTGSDIGDVMAGRLRKLTEDQAVWLCQPCHYKEHQREAPVIVTAGFP